MVVYSVSVTVREGHEEDFHKATLVNHRETRKEPGNLRFDVLQNVDNPRLFMLYEVYRSDQAVSAHRATQHYSIWRHTVTPWMEQDRVGIKYVPKAPAGEESW